METSPTVVSVSPVEGERNMFYLRLRTEHYRLEYQAKDRGIASFSQLQYQEYLRGEESGVFLPTEEDIESKPGSG